MERRDIIYSFFNIYNHFPTDELITRRVSTGGFSPPEINHIHSIEIFFIVGYTFFRFNNRNDILDRYSLVYHHTQPSQYASIHSQASELVYKLRDLLVDL